MYMAHPAMISFFGTYTKEETLLIVCGKKEEVLIFCSHSVSVSVSVPAVLQWIVSSPRQSGHMDLTTPHRQIISPLLCSSSVGGTGHCPSAGSRCSCSSSTCSLNWSLNNMAGTPLSCLPPAHLRTHSCAQVKKDLPGTFTAVLTH